MLLDALKFIFDQNRDVKMAKLLDVPGDPRVSYIQQDGELMELYIKPPLRNHQVDSVADLCAAALTYGEKGRLSLWICGSSIVLITDDDDRRDRVTLKLRECSQWSKIKQLSQQSLVTQEQLITLLKVDLPGAAARAELLQAVRSIKFRSSTSGHSDFQHGSESLGREIESQLSGASAIPEQIYVTTHLYDNPGENHKEYALALDLEIKPSDQKFKLKPLPGDVEAVQNAALESIREEIVQLLDKPRLFFGTP